MRWRTHIARAAGVALTVGLAAQLGPEVDRVWTAATAMSPMAASDAKPIFLTTRAVAGHQDPTDPTIIEALATTHRTARNQFGAHRPTGKGSPFASVYPPSLPRLLAPVAADRWSDFLRQWRALGLGAYVLGALAAGAAASGRGLRPFAAVAGLAAALWLVPALDTTLALGQANALVAGILGMSVALIALGPVVLGALTLVLGGAVKLVPLVLLWPLVVARRWTALLLAFALAVLICLASAENIGLVNFFKDIGASLEYTSRMSPEWLYGGAHPTPPWLWKLHAIRTVHLGGITVLLAGTAAARVRWHPARQRELLGGAAALMCAWLAVLSSPGQLIYAPLLTPALAWLVGGLFGDLRVRPWMLLLAPLVFVLHAVDFDTPGTVAPAARLMLVAWGIWGAVAIRVLAILWPTTPRSRRRPLLALAGVATVLFTAWTTVDLWA